MLFIKAYKTFLKIKHVHNIIFQYLSVISWNAILWEKKDKSLKCSVLSFMFSFIKCRA